MRGALVGLPSSRRRTAPRGDGANDVVGGVDHPPTRRTTMAISRTKRTVLGAVGAGIAANPVYDGYVGGKFVVTSHDAHLNAKVGGYGWAKLKQVNSNTTVSYSSCISGRD